MQVCFGFVIMNNILDNLLVCWEKTFSLAQVVDRRKHQVGMWISLELFLAWFLVSTLLCIRKMKALPRCSLAQQITFQRGQNIIALMALYLFFLEKVNVMRVCIILSCIVVHAVAISIQWRIYFFLYYVVRTGINGFTNKIVLSREPMNEKIQVVKLRVFSSNQQLNNYMESFKVQHYLIVQLGFLFIGDISLQWSYLKCTLYEMEQKSFSTTVFLWPCELAFKWNNETYFIRFIFL